MSALRDECIERRDPAFSQEFTCDWEKEMSVIVARLVGDDCENSLAWLDHVESLFNYFRES
jgi:hypothetical protein